MKFSNGGSDYEFDISRPVATSTLPRSLISGLSTKRLTSTLNDIIYLTCLLEPLNTIRLFSNSCSEKPLRGYCFLKGVGSLSFFDKLHLLVNFQA
jgi:hypothetical protein